MLAKLIPLDNGPEIVISKDVTVVGRKRGLCDLVLDHPSISKLHCIVARTDGLLFVRDLGSTNGTKVNGQRVLRGAILPGDELAFAKVKFRVYLGPDEPRPAAVLPDDRTEYVPPQEHPSPLEAPDFVPVGDDDSEWNLIAQAEEDEQSNPN